MGLKILLTGGSGFIGKNIKESFLSEKHQITAPSSAELDCIDDRSVESYFKNKSFDVVIHSACKPGHRNAPDNQRILYTNSRMSMNLLKHHDAWGKLINMGSGAIYGMDHYIPKMTEEYFGIHIPTDEHGYNKYLLGLLYPQYKNVIDFRIFGIFGKYEDYAIRFISNAICKSLFDLPISIRQNRKFDYLFIDDLMPILDFFIMNNPKHVAYNITPDHSEELLYIAQLIKIFTGNKNEIIIKNDGLGLEYSGDNSRLRSEFQNLKFTSIQKSIEALIIWYTLNKKDLKKNVLLDER
jgi:UDP-glucose 4-epimerase